jgi:acyl carrier protein
MIDGELAEVGDQKKYNVRIDAEKNDVAKIFASVATLAEFIETVRN